MAGIQLIMPLLGLSVKREVFMTKEERAIKWFEDIPGADRLSSEERMKICSRVAKGTAAVFLCLLVAEFIILYFVSSGAIFSWMADVTNRFAADSHGARQYQSLALFGIIFYLPLFILPIAAGLIYRKKRLRAAVRRVSSDEKEPLAVDKSQTNMPQSDRSKSTGVGNADASNADAGNADAKNTDAKNADTGIAWLKQWEQIKRRFDCNIDLEAYFKKKKIGEADLDVLDLGMVHFATGRIVACDPFIELDESKPYIQTVPAGIYPVKIAVSDVDYGGIRYACAKVEVSDEHPVRYELAMTGTEDLDQVFEEDEEGFFGFAVDCGMACITDQATQKAFNSYWKERWDSDHSLDPFNDLFSDLLVENYQEHPKYQSELGDWLNWSVPETDCDLPIFSSGWGDGYYPVYFGYDEAGKVAGVYIHFIDVEAEFNEADAEESVPDFSEQKYTDWKMEVDGTGQTGFTMKEIEQQLAAIKHGDTEFMILTPPEPLQIKSSGRECSFLQLCRDEDPEYFHCEVSVSDAGKTDEALIYGKDRLSKEEVETLICGFIDGGIVPDTRDWEVVMELRAEKEDVPAEKNIVFYQTIAELVISDVEILSKLQLCFYSPQKYFRENAEPYEDRFFEGDAPDDKIIRIGIADAMIAGGTAVELDWKTDKEEFSAQIKDLADKHFLQLEEDWLEENGDIPLWCKALDEKWSGQGVCVAAIDIDSDSYVLFVCRSEVLEKLMALGKEVGCRFGFAKNM